MQTENRLFDDFARVASSAINTLGGLREEIEMRVKERLERLASEMDLITREEFDAVKAMAVKARAEQERLAARVAELESKLGVAPPAAKAKRAPAGSKAAGRTAAKRPSARSAKPRAETAATEPPASGEHATGAN